MYTVKRTWGNRYVVINNQTQTMHSLWSDYIGAVRVAQDLNRIQSI